MKLSVLMITYNHEPYVEQAVRGALAQRTDFEYEIVVGEDRSTDRTREILRRLDREHPGRLRLLVRDANLGMGRNFADTYAACRGEYVALLEGDDYWTDPHKLARQIAFLDANPAHAGCGHVVRYEGGPDDGTVFPAPCPGDVTFDDLLRTNPIPTCSVVYRRQFDRVPDWHAGLVPGDWPLHLMHAARGPFRVLPEVMGAYRVHAGGVWSMRPASERLENTIRALSTLSGVLAESCREGIEASRCSHQFQLAWALAREGKQTSARRLLRTLLTNPRSRNTIPALEALALRLKLGLPMIYQPCNAVWQRVAPHWRARPARSR